jgi:hypothetical protein
MVVHYQLRKAAFLYPFLWTESAQVFLVPAQHPPFVVCGEHAAWMPFVRLWPFRLLQQCINKSVHPVIVS